MTMSLSCHLSFDGHCEAAFRCYQHILGGAITTLLRFGESPLGPQVPADWQARILHAHLQLDALSLLGSDAFPGTYQRPQGFAVTLGLTELAQASRVFEALAEGGVVQMPFQATFWSPGFGVLVDRFGIPWEVNCDPTLPMATAS
jgi:PhnB protein